MKGHEMIDEILDFEKIDEDYPVVQYYECKLLKDFAYLKKGDKFDVVSMDYSDGILSFFKLDEDGEIEEQSSIQTELKVK